jgi:uncharacterized protein (TIGR00251 family)
VAEAKIERSTIMCPGQKSPSSRQGQTGASPGKISAPAPSCTLAVKVSPNAPRTEVVGWLGDELKIKVHAPPVEGRANDVLCAFLADTLGLPRRSVSVLRGETSRQKIIHISGLAADAVKARLGV